jgi:hypothetical protein
MKREDIIKRIAVMAELQGREISLAAAEVFLGQLAAHEAGQVCAALDRCLRELVRFPTVADVLARIPDGRPIPAEAFALLPPTERESVCWTEEMQSAWFKVRYLAAESGFQAQRTFMEVYASEVAEARSKGIPARWNMSLGHDLGQGEAVVRDAVTSGKISSDRAVQLLGYDPVKSSHALLPGSRSNSSRLTMDHVGDLLPGVVREAEKGTS